MRFWILFGFISLSLLHNSAYAQADFIDRVFDRLYASPPASKPHLKRTATKLEAAKPSPVVVSPSVAKGAKPTVTPVPTPLSTSMSQPTAWNLPLAYQPITEVGQLIAAYNKTLSLDEVNGLASGISQWSQQFGIDPKLLTSVIAVESSFRSQAISSSGAIGLGQLKPATAQWLGVNDPFDPMQNMMGAAKYLRFLLDRYQGSVEHALAAYFRGQGTVDRNGVDEGSIYYITKVSKVLNRFN